TGGATPKAERNPWQRGAWITRPEGAEEARNGQSAPVARGAPGVSSAPEGRLTVATGGATPKAERNPWKGRRFIARPGGAEVGCHGWSERSERNPWNAASIWIPPRRGGGWLPRVERTRRVSATR